IAIDYDGQGLFPGRAEKIFVQLKSNLDRAVTGTLSLDGHPGISGSGTSTGFTLPARSYTQCEFTLTGTSAGAYLTNLRYEADGLHGSRPAAFRVFGSAALVTSTDPMYDEVIIQESAGMKLTHELRGGQLKIKNKSAGHTFRINMPEPGPPFTSMRRKKLLMKSS